ncbi:type I pullulanase [Bifidobacterium mongoliense]|uniref:type I pullulanase n=1 Tax=Bifidobacterium mongoliense TaxID=518643 RepID=UPI0030EB9637
MKVIHQLGAIVRNITASGIVLSMALGWAAVAPRPAQADTAAPVAQHAATATGASHDTIAIAFQTNWKSVADECTRTYGPEGVGYVQISPPQESIPGTPWWTSYQPVSYTLDSKLGTEHEFTDMIATCKAAGVGIIADAVINHTTGVDQGAGKGTADNTYDADGNFPGIPFTAQNFHSCTKNIGDYTNAWEVQNCRLTGLQDLDTSQPYVQDKLAGYLKKLLDLGVYGFRVDAVKHIASEDVKAIKAKLAAASGRNADDIFFEQEVIGNPSEAKEIQPVNYLANGKVSEFNFTNHLSAAFSGDIADKAKGLSQVGSEGWVDSSKAAVFVTNWDTERGSALTYKKGSKYLLANAFMLGYPYGQPHIYSGYYFNGNDDGAPGATTTHVPDAQCPTNGSMTPGTWQCAQRWTAIRGMIGFHDAVAGTTATDWESPAVNVLGFKRGDKGYLALNNSDQDAHDTFSTSLPAGTYCNVYTTGDCSDTVTVKDDHTFTATIAKHSAIAIHAGATKGSWTGTLRSDPTDPDLAKYDVASKPATDTSRTIYYQIPHDWNAAYLYYGVNNWAQQGTLAMTDAGNGWVKATVDPKGDSFEYVFTDHEQQDSNRQWDNPAGGGNYQAQGHWTHVADHAAHAGIPAELQPYQPRTNVIVHYRNTSDTASDRGVYLWGTDTDGNATAGAYHAFTGTDSYGKVFETVLNGAFAKDSIGLIITTPGWDKVGGDRLIDASNGTGEIWVDGSTPDETMTSAPEQYRKAANAIDVTIHYHRLTDDYASTDGAKAWDIWGWADGVNGSAHPFAGHDEFGLTATYRLNGTGMTTPQFIVRYGGDSWEAKDPGDGNRTIPQSAITLRQDGSAAAEVWLVQGDSTVYTNGTLYRAQASIISAQMNAFNTIKATLNKPMDDPQAAAHAVTVSDDHGRAVDVSTVKQDGRTLTVTTGKDLEVTTAYTLTVTGYGSKPVALGAVVRSDAFDQRYAYDKDDLGATYANEQTTFKLWAPTAVKVTLRTFDNTDPTAKVARTYAMTVGQKGVWTHILPHLARSADDTKPQAYDYELTFADGTTTTAADPYATAAVANGQRSVVLPTGETGDAGTRMAPFGKATDAVIAETSIRDLTIDPSSGVDPAKRGKYLGVVQEGTHTKAGDPTGLDYLRSLGITHVQIMPAFDFASIDETKGLGYGEQYNWGYDPENYNVPEGSYSSDPMNPGARVREMKEMVSGLHQHKLRVIMDVVYNHVYDAASHAFNRTVPGYYFRYDDTGKLRSDSGCGNDVASERAMARRYIVHSVEYWAKNYNVDGFRFDLMGLLDRKTMNEVRTALNKIDPSIIVIGEGWDMTEALGDESTIQPKADKVPGVAFFNDSLRDALKGSVFTKEDTGFVSGKTGLENLVATNLMGCDNTRKGIAANGHCSNGKADTNYAGADQVVQYAEIHDNFTLYDKLKLSVPHDDEATLVRRAKLADSAIFLSQGITDMQLGQEFLRTKSGNGDSYNAGDAVNAIQWDRTAQYRDSVDYVKGLIALRRRIKALHMTSYADIAANMTILSEANGVVSYQLKSDDGTYVMIFNANNKKVSDKAVPAGSYAVLADNGSVDLTGKETTEVTATGYEASGLSATVLKQRSDTAPTDDTHTGGSAGGDNHTGIKPQNGHSNAPHAARGNGEASATATQDRRARIVRTGASVAVIAAALTGLALLGIALTMLTRRNPQQ